MHNHFIRLTEAGWTFAITNMRNGIFGYYAVVGYPKNRHLSHHTVVETEGNSYEEALEKAIEQTGQGAQLGFFDDDAGYDRTCVCGHPYHRHFDSYDNMYPCGCKYCYDPRCETFKWMSSGQLLAKHAELLDEFGVDSDKVKRFVEANKENEEFCDLAKTAKDLKKAWKG